MRKNCGGYDVNYSIVLIAMSGGRGKYLDPAEAQMKYQTHTTMAPSIQLYKLAVSHGQRIFI